MKLHELVNNPTYDLKDGYFTGDTKIKQFLNYKHNNKGYDFDAYKSIVEMYRTAFAPFYECELYPEGKAKRYYLECKSATYRGDSMNSGGNILKRSLQLSEGYWDNCVTFKIKGGFSENYKRFLENIDKFNIEVELDLLNKYLGLVHSIGNFIPVPEYFNVGRNLPTSDYWDLALYNINLWYENKQDKNRDKFIRRIFSKKIDDSKLDNKLKGKISPTKKWLNIFGSWESFVEVNFLQSFVDENNKPIPFWDNHFISYKNFLAGNETLRNVVEPQSIDEVNQFLQRVTWMIVQRGKLISNYVKGKNNST